MTQDELNLIAWTMLGEAQGEGREGLAAIAHVIENRAESGRYPVNLAAVATQKNKNGIHQFSTWNSLANEGNQPSRRFSVNSPEMKQARAIAEDVFSGNHYDTTGGATHFYSTSMKAAPYWWSSEAPTGSRQIGKHIFAQKQEPAKDPEYLANKYGAPTPAERRKVIGDSTIERLPKGKTLDVTAEGLTVRPVTTVKIDPITGQPIRSMTVSEKVQAAANAGVSAAQKLIAAKSVQVSKAPAVPSASDMARGKTATTTQQKVAALAPKMAAQQVSADAEAKLVRDRIKAIYSYGGPTQPGKVVETKFADKPVVAQPASKPKTQERLGDQAPIGALTFMEQAKIFADAKLGLKLTQPAPPLKPFAELPPVPIKQPPVVVPKAPAQIKVIQQQAVMPEQVLRTPKSTPVEVTVAKASAPALPTIQAAGGYLYQNGVNIGRDPNWGGGSSTGAGGVSTAATRYKESQDNSGSSASSLSGN